MSAEVSSDAGVWRRLLVCLCVGAVGALAIAGVSVVVHGKLQHIPSQPAREKVSTKAVTPPPIALPLVLQANPPVPSVALPPATSKGAKPPATTATTPARGGPAKVKHPRSGKRAGTQP